MNGIKGFQKKGIYIVITVCMVSLAIGSFCDYQLANVIFNKENVICIFLAAYGQLPVSLGMSISGTLLIYVCKKTVCLRSVGAIIGGILLNVMALFMCIVEPTLYYENLPIFVDILIAFALVITVNLFVLRYVKDVEKKEIIRFIKFALFVIIAQLILINLIKIPWGRPRMRMLEKNPQASFQAWWVIGSTMKETLMQLGVASEEFKSFPSGHTASATCILVFSVLPMMKVKYHKYANKVWYFGLFFAVAIGVSRLVMGAHFLSDITVGFLVSFLLISFTYRYFYQSNKGGSYE